MIWNTIKLAISEIGRNILRSSLTILGIVIGVAAVISSVTLGGGTTSRITSDISSLGSNMLTLRSGSRIGPGGLSTDAAPFGLEDVRAIQEEITGLVAVTPAYTTSSIAVYGNVNWSTSLTGTDNDYLVVRAWEFESGRTFTNSEITGGKLSCIIGSTVARELFGYQDPLEAKLRLGSVSCTVIGVTKPKGG